MYRDDELAATLQMQKVEERLSVALENPVRQLRYWQPSHLYPLVITVLFYVVALVFYMIWGSALPEYPTGWYSNRANNITIAIWLGPLLAVVIGALFFGLQWWLAKSRVNRFYSLYGPPPKSLKPSERLRLLEGRLEELQARLPAARQGD